MESVSTFKDALLQPKSITNSNAWLAILQPTFAYRKSTAAIVILGSLSFKDHAALFVEMEDFIRMRSVMMETMLMEMDAALLALLKLITNA
jgi:hypothetical protein